MDVTGGVESVLKLQGVSETRDSLVDFLDVLPEALREFVYDILGKVLSYDDDVGCSKGLDLIILTGIGIRCDFPCDIERVLGNEFISAVDIDDLVGLACCGELCDGCNRCPCGNDAAVDCSVEDSLAAFGVVEVAGCEIVECDSIESEDGLDC